MNIPVTKPYFDEQEQRAAAAVIASGWVTQGPRVQEFEQRFAEYVGAQYAVATTSATTALHAALAVAGVGPGDEVIVPSLSFIASANVVVHCGATPVFADIDPASCNLDACQIEAALTKRTKAIMPVHQLGFPAEIDDLKAIADKHGLLFVEDAACAIGSAYRGKKIGGHGNLTCFSFHPRKVITTGEGGMITTNDPDFAAKLRRFRHHGMSVSDVERHRAQSVVIESYTEIGYNYRLTDMQAAMGIVQLQKLPAILAKRQAIARKYNAAFANNPYLRVPQPPAYCEHNYQSYLVEVRENSPLNRNELMEKLLARGIATRRGVMAIHQEPCYAAQRVSLPQTERMAANTLILPLYPAMTDAEVEYVIETVAAVLS